jgi:hypothetical protein
MKKPNQVPPINNPHLEKSGIDTNTLQLLLRLQNYPLMDL